MFPEASTIEIRTHAIEMDNSISKPYGRVALLRNVTSNSTGLNPASKSQSTSPIFPCAVAAERKENKKYKELVQRTYYPIIHLESRFQNHQIDLLPALPPAHPPNT